MPVPIVVTPGDPGGIGPEILVKSLDDPRIRDAMAGGRHVLVTACPGPMMARLAARWGMSWQPEGDGAGILGAPGGRIRLETLDPDPRDMATLEELGIKPSAAVRDSALAILSGTADAVPGLIAPEHALVACLTLAAAWRRAGPAGAVVTAPIHKEAFRALGVPFPGHTEFLGALSGGDTGLTMFETRGLRIFFHTRHVALRDACGLVNRVSLLESIRACHRAMRDDLGLNDPVLAVAGLNPHNGEHGLFGDEEEREIRPAVEDARSEGLGVDGPVPADSVFHLVREGRWDAVLSLYHDQGHIAAKTLDFHGTVSITLGLKVFRSSVDHGTAFDIAGKGIANPEGMAGAILAAMRYRQ